MTQTLPISYLVRKNIPHRILRTAISKRFLFFFLWVNFGLLTNAFATPPRTLLETLGEQERAKKCRAGDAASCAGLALRIWYCDRPETYQLAAPWFEKACAAGDAESCWRLGDWTWGGQEDCVELGEEFVGLPQGHGIPQDPPYAAQLMDHACQQGFGKACIHRAYYRHKQGDTAQAIEAYRELCESQTQSIQSYAEVGCSAMEVLCRQGDHKTCPPHLRLARYETDCAKGQANSCVWAAAIYHTPNHSQNHHTQRSWELRKRACELGDGNSCRMLGDVVRSSQPGWPPEALAWYEEGCGKNNAQACQKLARLFLQGTEVPQDRHRAAHYLEQSCKRGSIGSCATLRRSFCTQREKHPSCKTLRNL